ncbi:ABC transporter substrate-binding protein [Arthrobacter sp. RIT-PI-e]|uniref:extracellular solute-binding protein n=1 Tax=Arthrobacter sp. RIT-PI-e TaxID=1681197 RepID=UPI000676068D|nr:extracellular solute-binding protein [Arthrobacter sp. RIT-PI-e]KNC19623.1 ABC transporter substrate-binding protein [Arthrobacter sp. RIT-PI-e]
MRHTRITAVTALGAAALLALSGCSSSASSTGSGEPAAVPSAEGEGQTVTVWIMQDDYTDETLEAINTRFTEETGADVDIQVQQWDGITTKISTALATSTPPDVLDIGNTQVAGYAANGGLLDLTAYEDDLAQGRTWLGGLADPARVDESLYAVPGFAGARAVIYNKEMWADAGITEVPETFEDFTAALDAVAAANTEPDFSPFYYPGQYWQSAMQFVWDAGGEIAVEDGGTWNGDMNSDAAVEGLQDFADFQNTYSSPASATLDNQTPSQGQVFGDGKTSAILNTGGGIKGITDVNPEMTADMLGTFPFPGKSGEPQPVMIGGSDWAIPARSQNSELALQWIKIASGPEIQDDYVFGVDGWIPNSTEAIEAAQATELPEHQAGFFEAALNSKATPAAATWSTIEGDRSINDLFSSIASGSKPVDEAATQFDDHLDSVLGAN